MARSATVYSDILDGGSGRIRCQLVVIDGADRARLARKHGLVAGPEDDADE